MTRGRIRKAFWVLVWVAGLGPAGCASYGTRVGGTDSGDYCPGLYPGVRPTPEAVLEPAGPADGWYRRDFRRTWDTANQPGMGLASRAPRGQLPPSRDREGADVPRRSAC